MIVFNKASDSYSIVVVSALAVRKPLCIYLPWSDVREYLVVLQFLLLFGLNVVLLLHSLWLRLGRLRLLHLDDLLELKGDVRFRLLDLLRDNLLGFLAVLLLKL